MEPIQVYFNSHGKPLEVRVPGEENLSFVYAPVEPDTHKTHQFDYMRITFEGDTKRTLPEVMDKQTLPQEVQDAFKLTRKKLREEQATARSLQLPDIYTARRKPFLPLELR